MYFHASTLLADKGFRARSSAGRRDGLRWTARALAYLFVANPDGWERCCAD